MTVNRKNRVCCCDICLALLLARKLLDVQTSHDAGAHLTITVGCELTNDEMKLALLGNPSFDLGQKGFLQVEAISAKAEVARRCLDRLTSEVVSCSR